MKIFSEEFENKLVAAIGISVVVFIALVFAGIFGGIEQGLLWR